MQQSPQELPAERQVTFKLAQADDTSFLRRALDNYATSKDDLIFSGRLYMPREKVFADESMDSRNANPRLVFVLEFPQSTMLQAGPHSPNQAKATRRSSLWVHASKSATSIRKAFSRLSIRPRTRRGSGDTEIVNSSSSLSVSGSSSSHTLIGNSKENRGSKVAAKNIGCTSPQDVPSSPLSPASPKIARRPSSSPEISGSASLVQARHTPPIPEFMALQPSVAVPFTKRNSTFIRGRDLPFPILPIGTQRRLSLPVLSTAEDYPEFGKRIASRASSYPPPRASRPPSPQLTTKAEIDSDSFRGRLTARKPLFAPPLPSLSCNSDVPLTQSRRTTSLLRVPPFPLPHRVSYSRGLLLAPLPSATCPSKSVREPCKSNVLASANERVGSEGGSKRRPRHLHLVNDNTRA